MVKIAVMMTAYNAERFIEDALVSLLRQRADAHLDIIVVNDGSTDGTTGIVRRLASEAPEIRLIETPNQGIARARNVALEAVANDTDLITWLDSDDLSPLGHFARESGHFARDPELAFFYGTQMAFRGEVENYAPAASAKTATTRGVQLALLMLRLDLARRAGPFDVSLVQAEDVDYLMRVGELGPRAMFSDDICVYYSRHPENFSNDGRDSRRWLAFAMLKSAQRRKKEPSLTLPKGFFAPGTLDESDKDWWFADTPPVPVTI